MPLWMTCLQQVPILGLRNRSCLKDFQVHLYSRMLADRSRAVRPFRIMTVVTLTGAAEIALILALMDW